MSHGDPKHPTLKPHPVKHYEVIATADAPGPWDAVKGVVFFDVINVECVPQGSLTGGRDVPNTVSNIEMTRSNGDAWKGFFYRDALQDKDYFGLGVCHWDATGVAADFTLRGVTFNASFLLKDFSNGPQTSYFRKTDFEKAKGGDPSLVRYSPADFTGDDPEVIKSRDSFFPVTIAVKEINP